MRLAEVMSIIEFITDDTVRALEALSLSEHQFEISVRIRITDSTVRSFFMGTCFGTSGMTMMKNSTTNKMMIIIMQDETKLCKIIEIM